MFTAERPGILSLTEKNFSLTPEELGLAGAPKTTAAK